MKEKPRTTWTAGNVGRRYYGFPSYYYILGGDLYFYVCEIDVCVQANN